MSFIKDTRSKLDLHRSFDVEDDFEFCPVNDENVKMYYYSRQRQLEQQQQSQHDPLQLYKILANASANNNTNSAMGGSPRSPYQDPKKSTPWVQQQQQQASPLNSYNVNTYASPSPKNLNLNYLSSTPNSAQSKPVLSPLQFKYGQQQQQQQQQFPVNSLQAKLNMARR